MLSCSLPAARTTVPESAVDHLVQREMSEWGIRGVALALVDEQGVLYAQGYGEAQRDSVFRCGSISKLFNAIAVMQQVEAGRLDLDVPLETQGFTLPILNPFSGSPPLTLRQLLSHRSGLPREAAVGGYLDGSEPGLAATIASVAGNVLVTRPTDKTRYSNLAPSIAGYLVERTSGSNFETYQKQHILGPLGMTHSAWTLAQLASQRRRPIISHMRVADGRGGWKDRRAPVFDLGTIPAGNLFSTVDDLGLFAAALLRGGRGLLRPETLVSMWVPQFTSDRVGFGIGFGVGEFRGHRSVGHSGAVYGHSTSLLLLPDQKLGVIVMGNEDVVNARIQHVAMEALGLILEGASPSAVSPTAAAAMSAAELSSFAGDYESQSYWARLEVRGGRLIGDLSGQPSRFEARTPSEFVVNSRIENATPVRFERGPAGDVVGFTVGRNAPQHYRRVLQPGAALPKSWRFCLGSYGPHFAPIVISERYGHLYAMTENMVDYRLMPVNRTVCLLPPGMYVDEQLVFLGDGTGRGRCPAIQFANMVFRRR